MTKFWENRIDIKKIISKLGNVVEINYEIILHKVKEKMNKRNKQNKNR